MNLKEYVEWKLTHSDKTAVSEGYPLILENCKKNKKMKDLKVYGNSVQDGTPTPENPVEVQSVGNLVTDESDVNFGKYKIPIVQKGGNLYDAKTYPMTQGYYVNGQSTIGEVMSGWQNYAATLDYIPCSDLRGKTITINHTGGNTPGICFYDDAQTFISGVSNKNGTSITTTVPNNASYYRFSILAEYIDEATVYVEQSIHNVFLDEPLRKIGDYADYIDFKNQRVVRNTGSTIFNGTENWTYEKLSYGNNFYVKIPDAVPNQYTQVMCNMGSWLSWTISNPYNIQISDAGNFNFRYEDYNNLTDFKNKLSEMHLNNQPLNVTYALKTKAFEDISLQLPKPTAKTTVFTVDSTIEPSNMHGKYIK